MKIKITKKLLKEDETEKRPRRDRTQRMAREPSGEEYMTPEEKLAKYGPLKGEPTQKVKVPFNKEEESDIAIAPSDDELEGIKMPEIPLSALQDEEGDEETESDDYQGSPVPGRMRREKGYFETDIDDNPMDDPLREIAKRHFKTRK
jgi:hypothetical protein